MKLSISTLGCPDWTFEQILTNFEALGVEGIEVRGIEGIVDADKIPYFFEENAADTLARVKAHHLKLVGFGTSASFHDPKKLEANIEDAKKTVDVCVRMGIPAIRVFGNQAPEGEGREETLVRIGEGIREVCRYANDKGVAVNLEIHGNINSVENVKPILDIAGEEPSFGILWDVQHSDKVYGDDIEPFYQLIRPYIRHIHLKDHFRATEPAFKLCEIGEGDIPLKKIVDRLVWDGYDGYFSFEWEKKWHPELSDPAIAFPKFAALMKEIEKTLPSPKRKLGVSTCGAPLTEESAAAYAAGGIESLELSYRTETYETLDWAEIARLAAKYRLRLNSVHLPFSGRVNIAQLDETLRLSTIERDCDIMKNAAAIGIKIAVVHPSAEPIADADRAKSMENSKTSLRVLADCAASLGMTIAVEDLPRTCLGRCSAEMLELASADERLRFCFDTNHQIMEPVAKFVRAIGDRIITLHVSDYDFVDERHTMPGEGDIDWKEFMDLLDEIGYKGVFTYEFGMAAETKNILRTRDLTPADYRINYESLVRRETPAVVEGFVLKYKNA